MVLVFFSISTSRKSLLNYWLVFFYSDNSSGDIYSLENYSSYLGVSEYLLAIIYILF